MSGGVEESYDLKQIRNSVYSSRSSYNTEKKNLDSKNFWEIIVNARKKFSVIGSNINTLSSDYSRDAQQSNGLVRGLINSISISIEFNLSKQIYKSLGHAYIITKISELTLDNVNHKIMRIYNPWGNEVEWKGEWSDKY